MMLANTELLLCDAVGSPSDSTFLTDKWLLKCHRAQHGLFPLFKMLSRVS